MRKREGQQYIRLECEIAWHVLHALDNGICIILYIIIPLYCREC